MPIEEQPTKYYSIKATIDGRDRWLAVEARSETHAIRRIERNVIGVTDVSSTGVVSGNGWLFIDKQIPLPTRR